MKKKPKSNQNLRTLFYLSLLVFLFFVCFKYIDEYQNKYLLNNISNLKNNNTESTNSSKIEYQKNTDFFTCINKTYQESEITSEISQKISELNEYFKKYRMSVSYFDLNTQFSYNYNQDQVYYAASTIKLLDALYIYTNAANNNLNLDDTLIYKAKNKIPSSKEMQNYNVGSTVSLRNLVKYAVTVSDNTAHDMLIDYIGLNNLKNYGNSLGANYTLNGSDEFGEINSTDGIIYLKELNNFFNRNVILGNELKSYFISSEQNYLNFSNLNILAAQKYGEYEANYHELGIVYSTHPYLIAILTKEGNNDKETIIRDINTKIYELHQLFYQNRESYCYNLIYQ